MVYVLMFMVIFDVMKDEIWVCMGLQFKMVEDYGGQFDEEEVLLKLFVVLVVFMMCLGWCKLLVSGKYLGSKYVWEVCFVVFIVMKSVMWLQCMCDVMVCVEVLLCVFQLWVYL